jgi:hypothetical protein
MRYLVPLARANESDCEKLSSAIAPSRPSSRQLGELYSAYVAGNEITRARVVSEPALVLRARAELEREGSDNATPVDALLKDLRAAAAIVHRAAGRVRKGALDGASERERELVQGGRIELRAEVTTLERRMDKEGALDAR